MCGPRSYKHQIQNVGLDMTKPAYLKGILMARVICFHYQERLSSEYQNITPRTVTFSGQYQWRVKI